MPGSQILNVGAARPKPLLTPRIIKCSGKWNVETMYKAGNALQRSCEQEYKVFLGLCLTKGHSSKSYIFLVSSKKHLKLLSLLLLEDVTT